MHLHTIVKVKADTAKEAIDRVRSLVENDYNWPVDSFDWFDTDAIKIIKNGSQEFATARKIEKEEHHRNLALAKEQKKKKNTEWQGFYLRKAGECLEIGNFWSTERMAYVLDWEEGKKIFYVDTDRHF